jgi:hypothetical protein
MQGAKKNIKFTENLEGGAVLLTEEEPWLVHVL